MSNSLVGTVYQKIIEDVIEGCVVTFEEEGVERKLLDECKKAWQTKISERSVAVMPWDPAPAIAPPMPAPGPTSRPQVQPPVQVQAPAPPTFAPGQFPKPTVGQGGVQIKHEPGTGPEYDLTNLHQPNPAPYHALEQNLKNKFGEQAMSQINQVQAKAAALHQNGQGQPQRTGPVTPEELERARAQDIQRQQQMNQNRSNPQQQYHLHQMQQQQAQQQQQQQQQAQQQQQRNTIGNAQTDGAGDWSAMVNERRAATLAGGAEADLTIKQHLEQLSKEREGGGLMQPMSAIQKERSDGPSRIAQSGSEGSQLRQVDGGADSDDEKSNIKDEDDEDAINSDLDDPDDDQPEETEEESNSGEFMLCTYDKVQRVKNKWKCTLKDGVLSTGGKEYVFHKAQGEFEW